MPPTKDEMIAANRSAWDEAAAHHREHDQYAALLKGFAEPGFSVLDEVMTARLQAIGIAGRDVAQFCCNNARELLSIKNLGAASATGFDFAEEFLEQGRELAAAGGIEAELVQTDIARLPASYDGRFDLVVLTITDHQFNESQVQFQNASPRNRGQRCRVRMLTLSVGHADPDQVLHAATTAATSGPRPTGAGARAAPSRPSTAPSP